MVQNASSSLVVEWRVLIFSKLIAYATGKVKHDSRIESSLGCITHIMRHITRSTMYEKAPFC